MAQDTLLGFPAHTLPYRCGKFITLSTASSGVPFGTPLLLYGLQFPADWLFAGTGKMPGTGEKAQQKGGQEALPASRLFLYK